VLLGQAGTSDVVDAHLVVTAAKASSTVLSSDPDDLGRLSDQLPVPVRVQRI
jgi:hypothetical protein